MPAAIQLRPLVVFALAFAAGIAWASATLPLGIAIALVVAGAVALAASGRRPFLLIAGVALCGLGCGALREMAAATIPASDVSRYATGRLVTIEGVVASDPQEQKGRRTFIVQATRIEAGDTEGPVTGQVFVTEATSSYYVLDEREAVELFARTPPASADVDYGDQVSIRGVLEEPRPAGNPGAFSFKDYLARRGIHCQIHARRPSFVTVQERGHGEMLLSLAVALRDQVVAGITSRMPEPDASVLLGILIGRRTDLPPDLGADFVHTGTVHILASAGLHVGILAGAILLLFRLLTVPRKATLLVMIAGLGFYAMVSGGRPSVTRAALMAGIYLAGLALEREPDVATSLATAALAILAWQPLALFESGFQLTFFTVVTLAVCMPVWDLMAERVLPYRRHIARRAAVWALDLAGVSIVAQLGAAPIVAAAYNEVSLGGFLVNLIVVPPLFLLIPLTLAALALGSAFPALGDLLMRPCEWLTQWIVFIVRHAGEGDWVFRAVESPPILGIGLYYAVLLTAAVITGRWLRGGEEKGSAVAEEE